MRLIDSAVIGDLQYNTRKQTRGKEPSYFHGACKPEMAHKQLKKHFYHVRYPPFFPKIK